MSGVGGLRFLCPEGEAAVVQGQHIFSFLIVREQGQALYQLQDMDSVCEPQHSDPGSRQGLVAGQSLLQCGILLHAPAPSQRPLGGQAQIVNV